MSGSSSANPAALLDLHEDDGVPDEIGERRAAAVLVRFADAEFRMPAYVERARLTEGLEEAVEEDLGLTFFNARDVFPAPFGKISKFFPLRHAGVVLKSSGIVSRDLFRL